MDGTARIIKRYVGTTILIAFALFVLNLFLLGIWVFKGMQKEQSPEQIAKGVAQGLVGQDDLHSQTQSGEARYALHAGAVQLLQKSHAWAMLLDEKGQVVWSYELPEELPRTYSLNDVAQFSRHYLQHYPVYVWEHPSGSGLVVVGYPQDSLAKYQFNIPIDWISSLPFRIMMLIVGNLVLAMLLSLVIGARLSKSIAPLVSSIHALADQQHAEVEAKGVLSDLAVSINHTSNLLQEKNNALQARDEARSNWVAGISHDIRTPLSMILGYASELEESEDTLPEQRRKAGIIRKQGENLRSLVQDLNLVSMLEYEMQPLQRKPLKLAALARQIASDCLNNGLDECFALSLDIQDESSIVHADEKLLIRAITNLVQNSIRHNPDGCRILLRTSPAPSNKSCSLIVIDDGAGIPEHELSDVLLLPYSTNRKRPVHNGHGLGLPMVARIAKAHQGQLILTSPAGEGLSAELQLPLHSQLNAS